MRNLVKILNNIPLADLRPQIETDCLYQMIYPSMMYISRFLASVCESVDPRGMAKLHEFGISAVCSQMVLTLINASPNCYLEDATNTMLELLVELTGNPMLVDEIVCKDNLLEPLINLLIFNPNRIQTTSYYPHMAHILLNIAACDSR